MGSPGQEVFGAVLGVLFHKCVQLTEQQVAQCPEDRILTDPALMTNETLQGAIMKNPDKHHIPPLIGALTELVTLVKEHSRSAHVARQPVSSPPLDPFPCPSDLARFDRRTVLQAALVAVQSITG